MKKLFAFFTLIALVWSCGSPQQKDQEETFTDEIALELTVGNFKDEAPGLVGQLVTIKGTADHICSHDGKKLFLIDVDMPGRVKVETGEDVPAFNSELEGYDFIIQGLVAETIVDEAYLHDWEEQLKADTEEHGRHLDGEHSHDAEDDDHHSSEAAFEQIENYRQMMKDQEVEHLSFYHIIAVSYEVVED
ncbi:MAG: hypothetical protein M0Q41_07200 [Bacteroidales bacterium]|nr:hypothetical protein [Bacteroidales bacterium]